jgi:hypothetical protein
MARTSITVDVARCPADAGTVDRLGRLQLAAQRRGAELLLRHASAELLDLIAFAGLGEVLRVEPSREAEEREERRGAEEERELGDLAAGELEDL